MIKYLFRKILKNIKFKCLTITESVQWDITKILAKNYIHNLHSINGIFYKYLDVFNLTQMVKFTVILNLGHSDLTV